MSNRYLTQFEGTEHERTPVKLLGIRGFYEDLGNPHKNDLGIYDDFIVRCIGEETIGFRASTDPGLYWIKHPMNPKGCAILTEATHVFKLGIHQQKYPALVQAEDFVVWRLDTEGNRKEEGNAVDIHMHSGGPGMDVGSFSAGCQVIQSPEGYFRGTWFKFFDPLAEAMHRHGQNTVPYKLLFVEDLK